MASLLPSSSTEVASLGKIATFVFRYRTINFLRAYGLAPLDRQAYVPSFRTPHVGDKRSISSLESDLDDEDDAASPNAMVPLYIATPKALEAPRSSACYSASADGQGHAKRIRL